MNKIVKSYFYWTYPRGNFHYDVMVTLILAFIFITPHVWDYGDKPARTIGQTQPMLVTGDGGHGVIITVQATEVNVPAAAPESVINKALRKAVEPVIGEVSIERWELSRDEQGNPVAWKVWAHR